MPRTNPVFPSVFAARTPLLDTLLMVRLTQEQHAVLSTLAAREQRTLAAMTRLLIGEALAARMPAWPGKGKRA